MANDITLDDVGLDETLFCEFPSHKGDRAVKVRDVKFRHIHPHCICTACFDGGNPAPYAMLVTLAEEVAEQAEPQPEPAMDAGRAVEFRWYCKACVRPVVLPASRFRQHCPECDARLLSWREWMDGDEGGLS